MAYEREDLQKIDDLAIEYYNEEDTARKKVLKEKIAVFFMNNLEYIIHGGRLKALLTDENKTELVRSASLMSFAECINKYNPYNDNGETIPFMAYFYKMAYFKALGELNNEAQYSDNVGSVDISEMYDICDDEDKVVAEYIEDERNFNETLAQFVGCIVQFQAHRDMSKSTNQTHLDYYRSFYTGDMVHLTRVEDFLLSLMNYEQLIRKSCSTEFLDYIFKTETRTLSEMSSNALKLYKELKNLELFGKGKLEREIKVPVEQNVYASFFDVSKVAVSKKMDAYEDYKHQLLGDRITA